MDEERGENGAGSAGHLWRLAPTRRNALALLGWSAVLGTLGAGTLGFVRFLYPRVLFEPPTRFKLGRPEEYARGSVSTRWLQPLRLWLVRFDDRFVALSAVCTHLGCTPGYVAAEDKYRCPCHGSGFRGLSGGWQRVGEHFEGPAPRPLERFALELGEDGELCVDKAVSFRLERGEVERPGAFLPYA